MIRQLIVFRRADFPGLLPDRNAAKTKSPEEMKSSLWRWVMSARTAGWLQGPIK